MKKKSKIILSFIALSMVALIFVGCNNKEEVPKTEISFATPNGVPATAISKMIKENIQVDEKYNINYSIENTADTLAASIMKGEPDVAIVPSNLAAQAYNKGLGYKIAGTTGFGALYLISTEDEISIEDLNGKEVYNIGNGMTPDIVFKALLKELNINEVTFSYVGGPTELAPAILGGKAKYAVVPEPTLTTILDKNNDIKIIGSLNDIWREKFNSTNGFPQASIIIKEDLIEKDKNFIKELLKEVEKDINWVNENLKDAATYSVDNGSQVEINIIEKSIESSNINFVKVKDNKEDYINYFKILEAANAKSIGEKVPDEEFFYEG